MTSPPEITMTMMRRQASNQARASASARTLTPGSGKQGMMMMQTTKSSSPVKLMKVRDVASVSSDEAHDLVNHLLHAFEAMGDTTIMARAAAVAPNKRAQFLDDTVKKWAEHLTSQTEQLKQQALRAEATQAKLESALVTAMADATAAQTESAFLREQNAKWREAARDEAASRAQLGVVPTDAAAKHAAQVATAYANRFFELQLELEEVRAHGAMLDARRVLDTHAAAVAARGDALNECADLDRAISAGTTTGSAAPSGAELQWRKRYDEAEQRVKMQTKRAEALQHEVNRLRAEAAAASLETRSEMRRLVAHARSVTDAEWYAATSASESQLPPPPTAPSPTATRVPTTPEMKNVASTLHASNGVNSSGVNVVEFAGEGVPLAKPEPKVPRGYNVLTSNKPAFQQKPKLPSRAHLPLFGALSPIESVMPSFPVRDASVASRRASPTPSRRAVDAQFDPMRSATPPPRATTPPLENLPRQSEVAALEAELSTPQPLLGPVASEPSLHLRMEPAAASTARRRTSRPPKAVVHITSELTGPERRMHDRREARRAVPTPESSFGSSAQFKKWRNEHNVSAARYKTRPGTTHAEAEEYFGMNVFSFAHPDEDDVDDNFLIGL